MRALGRLAFSLGLILMFPQLPSGLVPYKGLCLLFWISESTMEGTAFPNRTRKQKPSPGQEMLPACLPGSSFLGDHCTQPSRRGHGHRRWLFHCGNCLRQSALQRGNGRPMSSPSEFFTSCYCSLQGASSLQSVKVPPHLLVEKGSRNEGLGSRRMRPSKAQEAPWPVWRWYRSGSSTFLGHLHICFISQTQIRIHLSEKWPENTFLVPSWGSGSTYWESDLHKIWGLISS